MLCGCVDVWEGRSRFDYDFDLDNGFNNNDNNDYANDGNNTNDIPRLISTSVSLTLDPELHL